MNSNIAVDRAVEEVVTDTVTKRERDRVEIGVKVCAGDFVAGIKRLKRVTGTVKIVTMRFGRRMIWLSGVGKDGGYVGHVGVEYADRAGDGLVDDVDAISIDYKQLAIIEKIASGGILDVRVIERVSTDDEGHEFADRSFEVIDGTAKMRVPDSGVCDIAGCDRYDVVDRLYSQMACHTDNYMCKRLTGWRYHDIVGKVMPVLECATDKDTRHALSYMQIVTDGNMHMFGGTDGRRAAISYCRGVDVDGKCEAGKILVPKVAAEHMFGKIYDKKIKDCTDWELWKVMLADDPSDPIDLYCLADYNSKVLVTWMVPEDRVPDIFNRCIGWYIPDKMARTNNYWFAKVDRKAFADAMAKQQAVCKDGVMAVDMVYDADDHMLSVNSIPEQAIDLSVSVKCAEMVCNGDMQDKYRFNPSLISSYLSRLPKHIDSLILYIDGNMVERICIVPDDGTDVGSDSIPAQLLVMGIRIE